MNEKSSEYILGTSDEEIERLAYQHQVWLDEAVELWTKAEFGLGQQIVDIGCGPGFATLDLAKLVGKNGRIYAVDSSEKYINYLENQLNVSTFQNVTTQLSDVHSLKLPENGLDGAFARWVLCFVKNPERVLAEVHRCLKPGGRFVIQDYFNYLAVKLYPKPDVFHALFEAYYESVRAQGGSYDIAGLLPEMLMRHGFNITFLKPVVRLARPNTRIWNWVKLFNQSFFPKLVEQGLLSKVQTERFLFEWNSLENNPAAFFLTPPMLGIVATKN
jgi:SAM-dependent methyltransferase